MPHLRLNIGTSEVCITAKQSDFTEHWPLPAITVLLSCTSADSIY